jgi:DNA invertase Pin-like site-specific DNA recombinase
MPKWRTKTLDLWAQLAHQIQRTNMSKNIALYLRVSTADQSVENQERELAAAAKRAGWTIAAVFKDVGISGAKGRDKRPAFDRLCKAITRREFDLVAAWSVDRIGRSLQDLVHFLGEVHASGVDLYLHQQGLDTSTPAGKALFQMMGVFSEFERAMIVERTKAGMARARAQGKRIGRPTLTPKLRARIAELSANGATAYAIGKALGIDRHTAAKYV